MEPGVSKAYGLHRERRSRIRAQGRLRDDLCEGGVFGQLGRATTTALQVFRWRAGLHLGCQFDPYFQSPSTYPFHCERSVSFNASACSSPSPGAGTAAGHWLSDLPTAKARGSWGVNRGYGLSRVQDLGVSLSQVPRPTGPVLERGGSADRRRRATSSTEACNSRGAFAARWKPPKTKPDLLHRELPGTLPKPLAADHFWALQRESPELQSCRLASMRSFLPSPLPPVSSHLARSPADQTGCGLVLLHLSACWKLA